MPLPPLYPFPTLVENDGIVSVVGSTITFLVAGTFSINVSAVFAAAGAGWNGTTEKAYISANVGATTIFSTITVPPIDNQYFTISGNSPAFKVAVGDILTINLRQDSGAALTLTTDTFGTMFDLVKIA